MNENERQIEKLQQEITELGINNTHLSSVEDLIKHDGWKKIVELIDARIKSNQAEIGCLNIKEFESNKDELKAMILENQLYSWLRRQPAHVAMQIEKNDENISIFREMLNKLKEKFKK